MPVAIAMVAREMPDPIGTEFGVVADEVTYGSDLVTALHGMHERVGHEDLPLFVTAVSIQSSSGGNLREVLDGLSNVIRERGKLKRKVRAISTEGRMSAYILTAVPALLMAGIMVLMPSVLFDRLGQADDLVPARRLDRLAGDRQFDDVQDVELQVLKMNALPTSCPPSTPACWFAAALLLLAGGLAVLAWPWIAARGERSETRRRLKIEDEAAAKQEAGATEAKRGAREGGQDRA